MKIKKEVQKTIVENKKQKEVSEEEFFSILRLVAPGSGLRTALDGITNSGRGALIVVENELLEPLIDGGFRVNCKFTPQKLIELSKMDGAVVISKNLKRINIVNTLLTPDSKIKTTQTGSRHKAAERTAKQILGLVIALSERKKEIAIFYKNKLYKMKDTSEIVRKANEYLQILERERDLFDIYLENLNKVELRNYISLNQAIRTIQKGKVIQKISKDLRRYQIELGNEGKLFETRLKEILHGVKDETNLIIKDYSNRNYKKSIKTLDNLSYESLLDKDKILNALDHESVRKIIPVAGWRILSKTTLTYPEIEKIIKKIGFEKIVSTSIENPPAQDIISKDKFSSLKVELERLKLDV